MRLSKASTSWRIREGFLGEGTVGQSWGTCRIWAGRGGIKESTFLGGCECKVGEVQEAAWCGEVRLGRGRLVLNTSWQPPSDSS